MNTSPQTIVSPVLLRAAALAVLLAAAGCQTTRHQEPVAPPPPPPPEIHAPVATHKYEIGPEDHVVGELQITKVQGEDTLPDIARRFNLGYEEIVRANPGVDPWLPGVDREIVVPTQFVLPDAPREGIVINLAQLRVFYYPKPKKGEPQTVITHPIGIGKVGWQTPEGTTKVTGKAKNPTWFPPSSVRKEHREAGDPLPSKVPPGEDNPLGAHMLRLGWPSYLIHGTNKPYGVGLRSSHGCMRFYPEDIAQLYDEIPVGTKVTVVNQPFVFGWQNDAMYFQALPILEDDERAHPQGAEELLVGGLPDAVAQNVQEHGAVIDRELVNSMVKQPRGITMPVSKTALTMESFIAAARHVENRVPEGANWNGRDDKIFTAEELEAALPGAPPLKKKAPAPKPKKSVATKPAAPAKAVPAAAKPADPAVAAKPAAPVASAKPAVAAKPAAAPKPVTASSTAGPVVAGSP